MPALIPVDNTLGALFIGTVLASIVYGVTWLQVYSYYNSHCSRDRWPLKSFVAFLMIVDSANLALICYTTYQIGVTNFGDYEPLAFLPWSLPAVVLSAAFLEVFVQQIYLLRRRSPYLPAAISAISLTAFGEFLHSGIPLDLRLILNGLLKGFGIGSLVFGVKALEYLPEPGIPYQDFLLFIVTFSCNILCDALITFGMVYALLSNRTHVRRTNKVLNLLAIYAINCGILNLVFDISCITLFAKYRDALIYAPPSFVIIRLYFCSFMAILNSRDSLRETLDGQGGVAITLSQLNAGTGAIDRCGVHVTTEAITSAGVPKRLSPANVPSDVSISDNVIASDDGLRQ
ncbi:hypothetical protein V8E53_003617 [Lactarius tabidus]